MSSSNKLDQIDRSILAALQGDLDGTPEPYAAIAGRIGVSEEQVLKRVHRLVEAGVIRRIGAMIRHIEAGIHFNGMVVWKVEPERMDEVGTLFANLPEVSHCYERPPFDSLGGTLFTMIHSSSEGECMKTVTKMAEIVGVSEYEILFSERELKKVSMTYFED